MLDHKKEQMDKRCRKTRKAIKLALIKMMSEKELSDITITEIAVDAISIGKPSILITGTYTMCWTKLRMIWWAKYFKFWIMQIC